MEKLKIGDLVVCSYDCYTGRIGYGKVIKLYELITQREYQEYGPIITRSDNTNFKLEITVQIVGYDLREDYNEYDLGEIVEVDEIRVLNPYHIYRVITEDKINHIRREWELLMKNKLDLFYKNVNKPPMSGKKILNSLKF